LEKRNIWTFEKELNFREGSALYTNYGRLEYKKKREREQDERPRDSERIRKYLVFKYR
jgi:hypothetical protein